MLIAEFLCLARWERPVNSIIVAQSRLAKKAQTRTKVTHHVDDQLSPGRP